MGKKIKDTERPAEFSRIRDLVFATAKVPYDDKNIVHHAIYRMALRRFGLVDDSMKFQYPDEVSGYNLRSEEDITKLMGEVAKDYAEIDKGITSDPASMKESLWPLFTAEHNPNYPSFVDGELASIKMSYSQLDKILKAGESDMAKSREAAKGTSLEGTVGIPFGLAENLLYTINLRYIQSFGYKLPGFKEAGSSNDLFDEVQRNLADGAPFKLSKEEQKERDLAELAEFSKKNKEKESSPVNAKESTSGSVTEKAETSTSINSASDANTKSTSAASSSINPAERAGSDKATEISGGAPSTSSTPAEVTAEAQAPTPAAGENILNVQMEPTPVTFTSPESSTIINQSSPAATPTAPVEAPTSTSTSEKILKTESEKSTVNETKVKKGGFSKFMEKITESKLGQSLNLPGLTEAAKDFAKVTKSEVLGKLPDFEKVKTGPNLINQLKESSKESVQAFKESTKTNKALEVMNQAKEMISSKEKEKILETSPQVSTETTKTETIEKSMPTVTPAAVSNTTNLTQNQGGAQTSTNVSTQTTQEGSSSSQTVQNNTSGAAFQPAQMTTDLPQTQVGGQPGIFNTSEMEERLRRIEHALINGLEVTIKQY